jgi:hypothetical protein
MMSLLLLRGSPHLWGPPSEVGNLTVPVLTAPLVVAPTPTPPEVGAPKTLRRSSRNAGKVDEHILRKTERLARK